MIDGKELGDVGFQYLCIPYSQMDCQSFVEKCLADCGLKKNLAGSNAWYREVYNHGVILTPEECVNKFGFVPKGAFLFIVKNNGGEPEKYKSDGLGNASHIGICTIPRGEGAIHSSSSRGCVAESKFKQKSIKGGWNMVGLWDKIDYGISSQDNNPVEKLTVFAPNGGTVKMRAKPSVNCDLYWDVPNGSVVDLIEWKNDWSHIMWDNRDGYMMSSFLVCDGENENISQNDMISVKKEELLEIYDKLGKILGMGVG